MKQQSGSKFYSRSEPSFALTRAAEFCSLILPVVTPNPRLGDHHRWHPQLCANHMHWHTGRELPLNKPIQVFFAFRSADERYNVLAGLRNSAV